MGFFSDLREDLSQAVNELMPEEEQIKADTQQSQTETVQKAVPEEVQETAQPVEEVQMQAEENRQQEEVLPKTEQEEPQQSAQAEEEVSVEETAAAEESVREEQEEIEENKGAEKMETTDTILDAVEGRTVLDETSVITKGMSIKGDITTEGSIDVIGEVQGNIDALGKLNITGSIIGNSKAAEIYAESAKINGEIVSEGAVKVGSNAVIIGNITASSAVIAGAVKGDIDVKGPVVLDASAIVMGNIKSKSVQINNGAVIEGMCSQCYAEVSPAAFFSDYKAETTVQKKSK